MRRYAPLRLLEVAEGDLDELFARRLRHSPRWRAALWYWKEVLIFCWKHGRRPDPGYEQTNAFAMWKNYVTVGLRQLRRHWGYAALSVSGLAVGLACAFLILLFVQQELRYDAYHEHGDRTYRLVRGGSANLPTLWAPALEDEVPGVEHAVRLMGGFGGSGVLVRRGAQTYTGDQAMHADAGLFEVFSWPLLGGDPATALRDPYTLVLTEAMARKYFGHTDVVGQTLTVGGFINDGTLRDYTITGVLAAIPPTTHVRPDLLISFRTVEVLNDAGEWGTPLGWTNRMAKTYLRLAPETTPADVLAEIPGFIDRHIEDPDFNRHNADLQPLPSIHLHSDLRSEFEPGGNITYVYLFGGLALFILLLACVNFMNLATARSQQRGTEVGLRKAMGAVRGQLRQQFLTEAVLYSLAAFLLGVGLFEAMRPLFSDLVGQPLPPAYAQGGVLLVFAALALGVGLLAGSYPAFVLASFRPVAVLKGQRTGTGRGALLRKSLVVFQFVVSIALLAGTFIVLQQVDYLKNQDLGFAEEQVVVIPMGRSDAMRAQVQTAKATMAQHPSVVGVTASHSIPSQFLNDFYYRRPGEPREARRSLDDVSVDHDFMALFQLRLLAGRTFDVRRASDSTAFVLNERAAREFGWTPQEAVGKEIEWMMMGGLTGPVIGVVEDFHFGSLHQAIPPISFHISRFGANFLAARVQPTDLDATLAHLEQAWATHEPDYPFEYYFMDEYFAAQYAAEERLAQTFAYGAGLAILIACLGLFGLAAFAAQRRRKELGVRKVLGASVGGLFGLLTSDFLKLVVLAFVLAVPLAYVGLSQWLQQFPYRTEIGLAPFAWAGLLTLLIAVLTVGYQSLRAALTNPVEVLRTE